MAVAITRDDFSASDLRQAAARRNDSAMARRALALALVLEGKSRSEAARSGGMDRQTLRDWVHRYNELGLDGLRNRPNLGAPPGKLAAEQEQQVATRVRQGPDPERHKVVRWRLVDLRDEISRQFDVQLHERSVGKPLARLNFSPVSARPRRMLPRRRRIKKLRWSLPPFPTTLAASRSNSGGRDEATVGQQGSLTYVWAENGSRPRMPPDQRYKWTYIFGAVCPARGVGAALILPHVNTHAMNLHLEEISTQVTPGACRSHPRRRWLASVG
jgi:transposase